MEAPIKKKSHQFIIIIAQWRAFTGKVWKAWKALKVLKQKKASAEAKTNQVSMTRPPMIFLLIWKILNL